MNSTPNQGSLEELCESGRIEELLREYLEICATPPSRDGDRSQTEDQAKTPQKSSKTERARTSFPNLAGFCRYLGVGTGELEGLSEIYPSEHGKILAVFEDEALNSGLSATLISAYLKKRLGYDTQKSERESPQLQISFEHDIIKDGE